MSNNSRVAKKTSQREEPFFLQFSSFFLHASVSSLLIKSLWLNISVCRLLACMLASSYLAEVESRTQGSRPRTQKKSDAKAKDSLSEDRHSRGQGQECSRPRPRTKDTSASALQKKRSSQKFFRRSQKKKKVFTKIFQAISTKNVF